MYEKMYHQIQMSELLMILKLTGCMKPCYYKQYSVIGEKTSTSFQSDFFTISFWAISNDTRVKKELLVYPITSLVAEFGGTLGLFLGFSFMALWDGAAKLACWGRTLARAHAKHHRIHMHMPIW
jgi:hypothetical protein